MQLLEALNWRYAVKQFSNHTLEEARLHTLLEATRLSPSAYGLQPYKLLLVEDQALRAELVTHSYDQQKVLHSSHLLVFAACRDIDSQFIREHMTRLHAARQPDEAAHQGMQQHYQQVLVDQPNTEQRQQWIRDQTFLALGNLLTSAALLQIDTCPMTGIIPAQYDRLLGLEPHGLTTLATVTLGFRHPHDDYASQPKVRLGMEELVMRLPA